MEQILHNEPDFIVVDLFSGAGGTTIGVEEAFLDGTKVAVCIAAVNHDHLAIKSHWMNHKHVVHYEEDIRNLDLTGLVILVNAYRKLWPNAKVILWGSLPCPHFSKAKGGGRKRSDMRTLAWALCKRYDHVSRKFFVGDSYIQKINPDYIHIENVTEFESWGPLDKFGNVVKDKKGQYFKKWCRYIQGLGYSMEWRKINAADHGAYTKRTRLFGCFAKGDQPIIWPEPSHSKLSDMFTEKWKPVKEVLDFKDEGVSIFPKLGGRKKPLSPKTYRRVISGVRKYMPISGGAFLLKYNSTNQETGAHVPPSIEEPAPVISTQVRMGLVQPQGFMLKYHGNNGDGAKPESFEDPASTLTVKDRLAKVNVSCWIDKQYSEGTRHESVEDPIGALPTVPKASLAQAEQYWLESFYSTDKTAISINDPCPTVTTKPHEALIKAEHWIDQQYGNSGPIPIEDPVGALTANPKNNLVQSQHFIIPQNFNNGPSSIEDPLQVITANRKYHYLVNPQFSSRGGSVDDPCFTLIARMDKAPPYLVTLDSGHLAIEVYESDIPEVRELKELMAAYGIIDIKMRMLRIPELKKIQGFPEEYILLGKQEDQKKFIGNSVHKQVPKRWYEAKAKHLRELSNVA